VRQARKRRKERDPTQLQLAALANVGRSMLNRFENQKGDVCGSRTNLACADVAKTV
jgi:transcriptional regulator with XRE-family HTH domain